MHKVFYTRYQFRFYWWLMETVLKLSKFRKYYKPDCTFRMLCVIKSINTQEDSAMCGVT